MINLKNVTPIGGELKILINVDYSFNHDWMSFASWYSINKNLPDKYDLSNLELIVPADSFYVFDKDGNLIDEIHANHDEIVSSALSCVQHIHEHKNLSDGPETEWEVVGDALFRTNIKCFKKC